MKNVMLFTVALFGVAAFSAAHAADTATPAPTTAMSAAAPEMTTQFKIMAKEEEGALADGAKSANEACGSTVTSSIDWSTFKNAKHDENQSISAYCRAPADALYSLCGSNDAYKGAVTSKIKEIKCSFGPDRKIDLTGSTINYTVDFKSSNDEDFAKDYLNTKL